MTIWEVKLEEPGSPLPVSPGTFLDLCEQNQSFVAIAAYRPLKMVLTIDENRERFAGAEVTPGFFSDVLTTQPALGRGFLPVEAQPAGSAVVILSHGLWVRRFGSDPEILEKEIILNKTPHRVVGVLPNDFMFENPNPDQLYKVEVWRPLALRDFEKQKRGWRYLNVIGRLHDSTTVLQAHSELTAFATNIASQHPETNADWDLELISLKDRLVGHARLRLWILFAAGVTVLLTACGNVTNLLICQTVHRQQEFAICTALGASRRHLMKDILAESIILASVGGVAGAFLAIWLTKCFILFIPVDLPRVEGLSDGAPIVSMAFGASILVALLCAGPAIAYTSRADLFLLRGAEGLLPNLFTKSLLRKALVGLQIAMTAVLLICSGLLLKSFWRVGSLELGFDPAKTLTMEVGIPWSRYQESHQVVSFYDQLLSRVVELPGVLAAGAAKDLPLTFEETTTEMTVDTTAGRQQAEIAIRIVSSGYFEAMTISIMEDRGFLPSDFRHGPAGLVVNAAFSRKFWPNEKTIGKKMTVSWLGQEVVGEVVGVVADVRHRRLEEPPEPAVYVQYRDLPYRTLNLVVRSGQEDLRPLASTIRAIIVDLDKSLLPGPITTMDEIAATATALRRFTTVLVVAFTLVSLFLSCVGLYGIVSYSVDRVTHQIGIRMALGATTLNVLRESLLPAGGLVVGGLLCGVLSSLMIGRLVESLLYDVRFYDLSVLITSVFVLSIVALVATYGPARNAAKLEVATCLRYE